MRRALLALALLCGFAGGAHAQGSYAIYGDYPNVTVTGTTSETLLASVPVQANALGVNGLLRLTWTASYTNSANNKSTIFRVGPSSGVTGTGCVTSVVTTTATVQQIFFYRNRGTASTNACFSTLAPYGSLTNPAENVPNINTAAPWFINITMTLASAGDSFTLNGWTMEIINP